MHKTRRASSIQNLRFTGAKNVVLKRDPKRPEERDGCQSEPAENIPKIQAEKGAKYFRDQLDKVRGAQMQ